MVKREAIHYSILIHSSPTNGMFEWINLYQIATQPSLLWLSCSDPFRLCSTMWTWSMWSRTRMTMSERFLLVLLDRWNHCHPQYHNWHYILDIYEGIELWVYLDPVPSHNRFHQCSGHSRNPRFGRTNGHSTCFVQWIERDWDHSKSPSDPGVFVPRPILWSEDWRP